VPLVRWQIWDQPPPKPSVEEVTDEIRLMLADAGIGPEPFISFDHDGELRLVWVQDVEKVARALVTALAPEIRRQRRARRSMARARARTQNPAPKPKRKDDKRRLIELVQQSGGRWLPVSPPRAVGHGVHTISASVLSEVRRHAVQVHRERPGFESLGALVLSDDGRAIQRYTKLANPCRSPGHAQITGRRLQRRSDGHPVICCHSHPEGQAKPSKRDVETAGGFGWSMFAIHGVDGLRLWAPDGDSGCREVAFQIEA